MRIEVEVKREKPIISSPDFCVCRSYSELASYNEKPGWYDWTEESDSYSKFKYVWNHQRFVLIIKPKMNIDQFLEYITPKHEKAIRLYLESSFDVIEVDAWINPVYLEDKISSLITRMLTKREIEVFGIPRLSAMIEDIIKYINDPIIWNIEDGYFTVTRSLGEYADILPTLVTIKVWMSLEDIEKRYSTMKIDIQDAEKLLRKLNIEEKLEPWADGKIWLTTVLHVLKKHGVDHYREVKEWIRYQLIFNN